MENTFFDTLFLTFKMAFYTTLILLFIGTFIAYFLSNYFEEKNLFISKLKPIIETLVTLPIVLPPSVIGFYILIIFSPYNMLGQFLKERFDFSFAFTFEGVVMASVFFSLPFMVNPIYQAINNLPSSLKDASFSLGKGRFETFVRVIIPCIRTNILSACMVTFSHTVGEFGIVLMVGGNIPKETRVASIAIYDEFESLNFAAAHQYSLTLLIISSFMLYLVYSLNKKRLN